MAEAFGLDRKNANHKGTRPIFLWSWDLDCLLDVIPMLLNDPKGYPNKNSPAFRALESLRELLRREYQATYLNE